MRKDVCVCVSSVLDYNTDFTWDAQTGHPVANAVSWQDLRTLPLLDEVPAWSLAGQCRRRLGYAPGPYSSALHLAWRMRRDPAVLAAARAGRLRVGLSAAWLLATQGKPSGHHMDYSLVQALGLYDFRARRYWDEWLHFLDVPRHALPQAVPTLLGGCRFLWLLWRWLFYVGSSGTSRRCTS